LRKEGAGKDTFELAHFCAKSKPSDGESTEMNEEFREYVPTHPANAPVQYRSLVDTNLCPFTLKNMEIEI
jgi:hypothetical protein